MDTEKIEKTETFEELWHRLQQGETAQDIVSRFQFWMDNKILGDEATTVARTIFEALQSKLATAPEDQHLSISRAALQAFHNAHDAMSEKNLIHAVENEWEPWRRARFYEDPQHAKYRPVGWVPVAQSAKPTPQGAAPEYSDDI